MDIPETVNELTDEDFKSVGSAIGTGEIISRKPPWKRGTSRTQCTPGHCILLAEFHPIPENDRWWGKGSRTGPMWLRQSKFYRALSAPFPRELGFYDLQVPEVRQMQVNLAREHGIYGFCYHHYWFHGRRLLERPFNEVLNTGKPDFPFCLCWANENWTRRWDGAEQEILIAQSHSREDDIAFIRDVIPAFRDERYIRIDGKPLLIVYRVNLLPKPKETAEIWRKECSALGIGDIFLCAAQTFDIADPRPYGFDAAVEFPPHGLFIMEMSERVQVINPDFKGLIHNYAEVLRFMKTEEAARIPFRTVIPSWIIRHGGKMPVTFLNTTLDLYQDG
jgi:lipopolysaccharide biosynthesis protein